MPTFLFKDSEGNVNGRVSAPPGATVCGTSGVCDPNEVQVGDSIRFGGGGFRKVDEILPDEV
jgi:hypothetical protein